MNRLRDLLNSGPGKGVAFLVVIAGLVVVFYIVRSNFGGPDIPGSSMTQTFVCTETGKTFEYTLHVGETMPVPSPFSGKKTGILPERCYWTKDGKPKADPTYVLLNERVGSSQPTFCKDCDRLVIGHNPPAGAGEMPPPTKAEYLASAGKRRQE